MKSNAADNNNIGNLKSADFRKYLEPAKEFIEQNPNIFPIGYENLISFLNSTAGSSDLKPLVAKFSDSEITALFKMLTDVHPHVSHRGSKNKITRIRNKLSSINSEETKGLSNSSSLSSLVTDDSNI